MDGLYINGQRPASKKLVKETVTTSPESVRIECTSLYGGYDGLVSDAPNGSYPFVGPDPYTSRKFYGTIVKSDSGVKVK